MLTVPPRRTPQPGGALREVTVKVILPRLPVQVKARWGCVNGCAISALDGGISGSKTFKVLSGGVTRHSEVTLSGRKRRRRRRRRKRRRRTTKRQGQNVLLPIFYFFILNSCLYSFPSYSLKTIISRRD